MTQERFKPLSLQEMTPEQRRVAEAILAGPRQSLSGPFSALLYSPELGDRAQRLGEHIRFGTSLPPRLKELAILITARHWSAQFEWYAHHRFALEAGLDPAIPAAIAHGRRPEAMQQDEAAVYDFCTELLGTKAVSDATFQAATDHLGTPGVIDLVGTMGYYGLVSMILNVNRYPLPEGVAPLPPLGSSST